MIFVIVPYCINIRGHRHGFITEARFDPLPITIFLLDLTGDRTEKRPAKASATRK
jgi:hypothetical protein